MKLNDALDVVLDLAQQNEISPNEAVMNDLHYERERQQEALEVVHKLLSFLNENSG